jgi:type III secretory pathway component EscS
MFAEILWGTGTALEGLLVFRSLKGRIFAAYPVFYVYLTYIFLQEFARFYVYLFHPTRYLHFYWYTQFFSVVLGYGVIWEIYRQALKHYPGAARAARSALALIFVFVLSKVLVAGMSGLLWSFARTTAQLERDLRIVQAALLIAIVALLAYYAIPAGRNLKGMIVGYGLFIGASIITLTFRSYFGDSFQPLWQYLPAATYYIVLIIWCFCLWSYHPSMQPEPEARVKHDYELLAKHTTKLLNQVRTNMVRVVRS